MSAKKKQGKYVSEWKPYITALEKARVKCVQSADEIEKVDIGTKVSQFEVDISLSAVTHAISIIQGAVDNLRRIDEIAEIEHRDQDEEGEE